MNILFKLWNEDPNSSYLLGLCRKFMKLGTEDAVYTVDSQYGSSLYVLGGPMLTNEWRFYFSARALAAWRASLALGRVNYWSVLWLIEEAEQDPAPSGGFWTSLSLRITLLQPRRKLLVRRHVKVSDQLPRSPDLSPLTFNNSLLPQRVSMGKYLILFLKQLK